MLKDYRCTKCNKLFFKGEITNGTIEVKCKNCKSINTIITTEGSERIETE